MTAPKLKLFLNNKPVIKLALPKHAASGVDVPNEKCPHCAVPLRVGGAKKRIGGHDFYTAEAGCLNCGTFVGELRLYVSTLFGLEEDERVLSGRVKVY